MTARLAADIGGTFTDVVLEVDAPDGTTQFTAKVLTTQRSPADAVLAGVEAVLGQALIDPCEIELVVHGTTLATNALIERRGARTALVCTEGFRDSVAMAHENRFEQYDIFMERPDPLVPRYLRLGVPERLSADGDVLIPLDVGAVHGLIPILVENEIESVAIGFLHSYVDPRHEIEARSILLEALPHLSVTLSSEVCPEIREYERLSTACANAYVQPLMATYLTDLADQLDKLGIAAPLMLMLSNGGLCTLDTALRSPVGLVESGPAGGALLAARIAAEHEVDELLSFDMGGTTAKLCLRFGFRSSTLLRLGPAVVRSCRSTSSVGSRLVRSRPEVSRVRPATGVAVKLRPSPTLTYWQGVFALSGSLVAGCHWTYRQQRKRSLVTLLARLVLTTMLL
jgi:N-methylhydantoinase A